MYSQRDSELNAIFRDTSGHTYSVQLKFIWAGLTTVALLFLYFALPQWLWWVSFILAVVPLKLAFAGLSEIIYFRKAKDRQLAGFDDLPPAKSTTKLTLLVFGGAAILILVTMPRSGEMQIPDSGGRGLGILIFLGLLYFKTYLLIFRPSNLPKLDQSELEAGRQSNRLLGRLICGATLHVAIIAALLSVGPSFG